LINRIKEEKMKKGINEPYSLKEWIVCKRIVKIDGQFMILTVHRDQEDKQMRVLSYYSPTTARRFRAVTRVQ